VARILVIDDEPRICRFIARVLEGDGHQVTAAGSGREALRVASEDDFALVILDLKLPGMSGFEVLHILIADQPGQRVVVLSAIGDISAKIECFAGGAVDYMAKPFSPAELAARVRARLRDRFGEQAPPCLRVGRVVLDPQRRTATIGESKIVLSHREFILLDHLMRRAGEVCKRTELLDQVWGYPIDAASNVLDVYVRRLRAKLGRRAIATVRNVGYTYVHG
jgi:DNA-binding response OmpR family regulator